MEQQQQKQKKKQKKNKKHKTNLWLPKGKEEGGIN